MQCSSRLLPPLHILLLLSCSSSGFYHRKLVLDEKVLQKLAKARSPASARDIMKRAVKQMAARSLPALNGIDSCTRTRTHTI
jgi:hypothetical protein